jgi:hypothetical protein
MRTSVGGLKERLLALADSTMGKIEELESDVVAAQPHGDAGERSGDEMAIGDAFHDDSDHEVASDADSDADVHAEPEAGSDEFEEAIQEEAIQEEAPHDQPDENTGQVFLGSGHRPWDRGESDG